MDEPLEPFVPSRSDPWDRDAAAHLLRRAGFGAPPADVEEALSVAPGEAAKRVVEGRGEEDRAARELDAILPTLLGIGDLSAFQAWIVARMLRCRHQLREKVALFWHNHFATSVAKVREPLWMIRQYRLFLDRGLGPFGALLDAVARDPAMLRWLDNETNRRGHANENFARELFELFTLGVGEYTEKDIHEAARAFTGWTILHDRFHFSAAQHDDGEKSVLGASGRLSGEEVLRIALDQPACGRFLAGKLLREFVTPEPDPAVAAALGRRLRETGYDVGAALAELLSSRYFFDRSHRRALVRSPVDFAVGSARALGGGVDAKALLEPLKEMGQELLAPPNVKGWPGGRSWISTATWLTRVQTARRLADALPASDDAAALALALLGGPLPPAARAILDAERPRGKDLCAALLALPETHLC